MTSGDLVAFVESAFAGLAAPRRRDVFRYRVDEPWLADYFAASSNWRAINVQLFGGHVAFGSFTVRAFQFVLPAYLVGAITNREKLGTGLDDLLFGVILDVDELDFKLERFGALSYWQQLAVRRFLEFERDSSRQTLVDRRVLRALSSYWETFNPHPVKSVV